MIADQPLVDSPDAAQRVEVEDALVTDSRMTTRCSSSPGWLCQRQVAPLAFLGDPNSDVGLEFSGCLFQAGVVDVAVDVFVDGAQRET